jgi:TonB family protein
MQTRFGVITTPVECGQGAGSAKAATERVRSCGGEVTILRLRQGRALGRTIMKWWHSIIVLLCLSSPVWAAVDQTPCKNLAQGSLRPVMETHTIPPYPASAKQKREEGISLLQVVIAPDGSVNSAELVKSSGSTALDEAAIEQVKQHWRWETQSDRCTAPITTRVQITWTMRSEGFDPVAMAKTVNLIVVNEKDYPPEALALKQSGLVLVAILQPESGEPQVYGLVSSGSPALDKKSLELAKARMQPAQLEGRVIGGIFTIAFIWTAPGSPVPDLNKARATMEFLATHSFGAGAGVSLPPK